MKIKFGGETKENKKRKEKSGHKEEPEDEYRMEFKKKKSIFI